MAGTAKRLNRILQKEIHVHAAWLPVTNTLQVGDYGVISSGVFHKMGNISEFGVDWQSAAGAPSKLDFSSEGTRVTKLVGDAEVQTLPDQGIDAKIEIAFTRADSFLLKANLSMEAMQNLAQTALALSRTPGWNKKYRVVNATYTGQDCVVISTREADSKVEISGKADALQQFDLGAVSAGFGFQSNKQLGLEIVGETGVVGLKIFKLGRRGTPKVLTAEVTGEQVEIEEHEDWDADLEDDV
jgi:hypothetical protein